MDAILSFLVLQNFIGFSRFFDALCKIFFFIKVSWFHYFPFYLVSLNFIGFSRFFDALCIPYIQFEDSEETEIVETRPKPIIDVCCNKGNTARSTMHSGGKKGKNCEKHNVQGVARLVGTLKV